MILRNNFFYHDENPRVDVNLIVNKNDRSYDIDAKGRLDSEVMWNHNKDLGISKQDI